jgi:hypothetical protein
MWWLLWVSVVLSTVTSVHVVRVAWGVTRAKCMSCLGVGNSQCLTPGCGSALMSIILRMLLLCIISTCWRGGEL